ncbi:hypothetical protein MRX96_056427 [Rhipicephalus microplus]
MSWAWSTFKTARAVRKPEALLGWRRQKGSQGNNARLLQTPHCPSPHSRPSLEIGVAARPSRRIKKGDSKIARNRPADGEESHFLF